MLTNKQEVAFFAALGTILLTFLILSFVLGHWQPEPKFDISPGTPAQLSDVSISAKSAYVYDTLTGTVIYEKNADARLPLASLTKVMSALVASDIASPQSIVVISGEAIKTEGDAGLVPGERWTLKSLLDFSLVSSANDGIHAVALSLGGLENSATSSRAVLSDFVHKMNLKADELGMKNTYFLNDTGLDVSNVEGGAYGSAKDMAILFKYILEKRPWILEATREPAFAASSLDGITHLAVNTDLAIDGIPGLMASKTGYTDLAGGNLVVAFDPEINRTIIISLLGSSQEGRFDDMVTLVRASLESIRNSVRLK